MNTQHWKKANLWKNNKFTHISAMSGRFGAWGDLYAYEKFLAVSVDDETLGSSLRKALLASRYITDDEELIRFYKEEHPKRQKLWTEKTMRLFGYTNEDIFFDSLIGPSIELANGVVTFLPNYRKGNGGYTGEGVPESDNVYIAFDSRDQEIGAAAQLALSRCK